MCRRLSATEAAIFFFFFLELVALSSLYLCIFNSASTFFCKANMFALLPERLLSDLCCGLPASYQESPSLRRRELGIVVF